MIRWITKNLGTGAFDQMPLSDEIYIIDVRDCVDKEGNNPEIINDKIKNALVQLNKGKKVVICCDYGLSRSNAVAAGVLARFNSINFENAVKEVIKTTGEKSINIGVLNAVRSSFGKRNEKTFLPKTNRLLITGSSGFIGRGLIDKIKNKGIFLYTPNKREIDLFQDTALLDLAVKEKGINTILHLANPRIYTTNKSMGDSIVMLKNVLDVCSQNNIRLIFLSGWEVYSGYKSNELWANETLALYPGGCYGQTKALCENLIDLYIQRFNLSSLILRSSPVYGTESDRPKFIWNFYYRAVQNKEVITHKYLNGFPKLDLLHVSDLRRAIIAALFKDIEGSINVGTGIGTSTANIAELIIQTVKSSSSIRHHNINGFAPNILMETKRAQLLLDWQAKVGIKKGIQQLIESRVKDVKKS